MLCVRFLAVYSLREQLLSEYCARDMAEEGYVTQTVVREATTDHDQHVFGLKRWWHSDLGRYGFLRWIASLNEWALTHARLAIQLHSDRTVLDGSLIFMVRNRRYDCS